MGVYNREPKASHCKAHTDWTRIFFRTCEMNNKLNVLCFAF